jgi:hypothetical protein
MNRRLWTATLAALGVGVALVAPRGPAPARAAFSKGTTSVSGACHCVNCGELSCQCLFRLDGTKTCNIDCVLCDPEITGVVGGGVVQLEGRQATVAVLATDQKENKNVRATGLLRWVDPDVDGSELILESRGITDYRPVEGQANTRQIRGIVFANGEGPFPFLLQVVAVEGTGDSVRLVVGDAADEISSDSGFNYTAEGPLVSGDLVGTWTPPAP